MPDKRKGLIHTPSLIVVLIAIVFTFGVAVWPGINLDKLDLFKNYWWMDIALHGGYYFLLAVVLFPLFNTKGRKVYWFFPALFVLSIIFEFLQHFSAGRNVTLEDMIGNFLGISLAAVFSYWGRRLTYRARKSARKT